MNSDKIINKAKVNPDKAKRLLARHLKQERANAFLDGVITLLGPDNVCIDCGANVGTVSERLAATGATVHAFEPDPVAFAELEARLGKKKNVVLHNAGVGPEADELALYRIDGFDENSVKQTVSSTLVTTAGKNYIDSGIKVEVVCLADFITKLLKKHKKVSVLKMDIEGLEVDVMNSLIEKNLMDHINISLVERHARKRPGAGSDFERFRTLAVENPHWNLNLDWV